MAAQYGYVDAVKVLLRAKADPRLTICSKPGGAAVVPVVPIDVAVEHGHMKVARELSQEHGIEGCGGAK